MNTTSLKSEILFFIRMYVSTGKDKPSSVHY